MINLVTGTPGTGKTLFVVAKIIKAIGQEQIPGKDQPRLIVHNINGFRPKRIPKKIRRKIFKLPPDQRRQHIAEHRQKWSNVTRDNHAADHWQKYPDGTVVVIDEVQEHWPGSITMANAPDHILALARHRHRGFDFWLITPNDGLLSTVVRKVVGRHYDLIRPGNLDASVVRSWEAYNPSPPRPNGAEDADVQRVSYDKGLFDVYRSASVHSHKTKLPRRIIILGALLVSAIVAAVFLGITYVAPIFARATESAASDLGTPGVIQEQPSESSRCFKMLRADPLTIRTSKGLFIVNSGDSGVDFVTQSGYVCVRLNQNEERT